ncbi:MAG: TonB-dependent receptor plug domain-containing protein [Bergeyella cardium]
MNKTKYTLGLLCIGMATAVQAQKTDSLRTRDIKEVVITGQFSPQSINKSVYKVEVIDGAQIKNMAANNVAEVLNQNLNMLIVPDRSNGNSYANILGLGGEYTKVLIDNIPVINDESLGNLIDLTKISVDNIEKIEVVRGSMGVEYGSNAVTGVINIITKKKYNKKFTGSINLQEETVNTGYDLYKKGKGRHIQNVNLNYNINPNWSVSLDFNHNDFKGYEGSRNGYKFFSETVNGKRGYDWQPKDLYNINGTIRYHKNATILFYKANLMKEEINYRSPITESLLFAGGKRTLISRDNDYYTQRWVHQLNIVSKLGHINYMGDFSYQKQEKQTQSYIYDVPNRSELSRNEKLTYYDINTIYSRGMFSNFTNSDVFNFQLGYELDRTQGFADSSTGLFGVNNIERTVFNYAHFLSAEWRLFPKFHIRPGARYSLNNKSDDQLNYSLALKYNLSDKSEIRLSGGSAGRFPTYTELYTYLVNANHDIRGNENLSAEKGLTAAIFADYKISKENKKYNFSISGMYLQVKDRIDLSIVNLQPLKYQYININDYRSLLFNLNFDGRINNFNFNTSASLTGVSQSLKSKVVDTVSPEEYFFTPEISVSAGYKLNKTQTLFSVYYKYNGKSKKYILSGLDPANNKGVYELGTLEDFNRMDATISQPFFKNHLNLSAGVKNIFDVTEIKNTTQGGSGHSISTTTHLFYGRSYFTSLTYKF